MTESSSKPDANEEKAIVLYTVSECNLLLNFGMSVLLTNLWSSFVQPGTQSAEANGSIIQEENSKYSATLNDMQDSIN